MVTTCVICGETFQCQRPTARYCSSKCANRQRYRDKMTPRPITFFRSSPGKKSGPTAYAKCKDLGPPEWLKPFIPEVFLGFEE